MRKISNKDITAYRILSLNNDMNITSILLHFKLKGLVNYELNYRT